MNYDEFNRTGYVRYEQFAETVASVLRAAIKASPQDFRLQQIQTRAKSAKSLKRKLTERGLTESTNIEEELKDLAGCRLIFYTNTDVDRFLNSRLIFENFQIDFDGSKVHHATGEERTADQLYFAIHYLVSLKEDRLALPEYAQFCGMRCEVQLQTTLNHAWAETSRDILYHPTVMPGFGTKQFEEIKKRLANIMNRYLLPAGYEFRKVQHDYERLVAGKELFDRGTLEALSEAPNNNERYEKLQRVRKDLLPFYDDVPAIAPDVIARAAESIKKARDVPTVPIETTFGNFDGHTAEGVSDEALQLIDLLRFVDISLTFRTLCDLYLTTRSDQERKRIEQSFETLAQNDLEVWKKVGFGVQRTLYEEIVALPEEQKKSLRPVIVSLCEQFLDTELKGTTWHFQSVTLHRGAVSASSEYGVFRSRVLQMLFDLYANAPSDTDKFVTAQAMSIATRCPVDGGRAELFELVLDDTKKIVQFFADRTDSESFELLQNLEHQFLYLYRRSKEFAVGTWGETVANNAKEIVLAIEVFRDRLNANDSFIRFKTLVGFESVFPLEWELEAMDIEGPEAYRAAQIKQYVDSITADHAEEWYGHIKRGASVKSNDGATFISFVEFLKQLTAKSPDIVLGYLDKNDGLLNSFLPMILKGLEESARADVGLSLVSKWIESGQNLWEIGHYLQLSGKDQPEVVAKLGQQAIARKDISAGTKVLAVIIARQLLSLVDDLFVPVVRMLTAMDATRWVHDVWYLKTMPAFLNKLSQEQSQEMLDGMVLVERIDTHDEWVLREIAKRYPRVVWEFFKRRIDRKAGHEFEGRYDDVPFHMTELNKSLAQDAALGVGIVRTWYKPDDYLFQFTGGRLLKDVFPIFHQRV